MPIAELERHFGRLDRAEASVFSRENARLVRVFEDAGAQLSRAAEPASFNTVAKALAGTPLALARSRLAGLRDDLTSAVLRWRRRAYSASYATGRRLTPDELLTTLEEPSSEMVESAISALIHGAGPGDDIRFRIGEAIDTINFAVSQDHKSRSTSGAVESWRKLYTSTVSTAFKVSLSDATVYMERIALRDVIRPEFLLPDPTLPERA